MDGGCTSPVDATRLGPVAAPSAPRPVDPLGTAPYPPLVTVDTLFPILRTTDLDRLVRFYEEAFDGDVRYRFAPEGRDVYVSLAVGGGTVGVGFEPDAARGDAIALWIYTDSADRAFARAVDAGAAPVSAPEDTAWGERMAQVRDPDGNLLYLAVASA